jgi:hypothetical protein
VGNSTDDGRKKERKKQNENEILAKITNMTQNNNTAVNYWYPLSFYCFVPRYLSLVLFPEMSASQPFCKGSGDADGRCNITYFSKE